MALWTPLRQEDDAGSNRQELAGADIERKTQGSLSGAGQERARENVATPAREDCAPARGPDGAAAASSAARGWAGLEGFRVKCAQRLQEKLQDPRLRATLAVALQNPPASSSSWTPGSAPSGAAAPADTFDGALGGHFSSDDSAAERTHSTSAALRGASGHFSRPPSVPPLPLQKLVSRTSSGQGRSHAIRGRSADSGSALGGSTHGQAAKARTRPRSANSGWQGAAARATTDSAFGDRRSPSPPLGNQGGFKRGIAGGEGRSSPSRQRAPGSVARQAGKQQAVAPSGSQQHLQQAQRARCEDVASSSQPQKRQASSSIVKPLGPGRQASPPGARPGHRQTTSPLPWGGRSASRPPVGAPLQTRGASFEARRGFGGLSDGPGPGPVHASSHSAARTRGVRDVGGPGSGSGSGGPSERRLPGSAGPAGQRGGLRDAAASVHGGLGHHPNEASAFRGSPPAISPQTAAHFNSLSETLQEAAIALRRIVPLQAASSTGASRKGQPQKVVPPPPRLLLQPPPSWSPEGHCRGDVAAVRTVGTEELWASAYSDVQATSELSPSIPSVVLLSPHAGRGSALEALSATRSVDVSEATGIAGHTGIVLAPTIQRLRSENTVLREALEDANARLSRLEDEKVRFFDEGIFDLVNSVCGQGEHGADDVVRAQLSAPLVERSLIELSTKKEAIPLGPEIQRTEDDPRSAELRGENDELRRELAYAREVGDALEQQHQAAEDRMRSLEQERMWLASRLANLGEGTDAGTGSANIATEDLREVHCISSPKSDPDGGAHRYELEDANQRLRSELLDASRLHSELLDASRRLAPADGASAGLHCVNSTDASAAEAMQAAQAEERLAAQGEDFEAYKAELALQQEAQRREAEERFEEFRHERSRQASIISTLDDQAQELERQLRNTEARALTLAEENARLQATLATLPEAGATALEAFMQEDAQGTSAADAATERILETQEEALPVDDDRRPDRIELDEAW